MNILKKPGAWIVIVILSFIGYYINADDIELSRLNSNINTSIEIAANSTPEAKTEAPRATPTDIPAENSQEEPNVSNRPVEKSELFSDHSVYITPTGKKYHKLGCRYIKSSYTALTLSSAERQGYEPCKVCKP